MVGIGFLALSLLQLGGCPKGQVLSGGTSTTGCRSSMLCRSPAEKEELDRWFQRCLRDEDATWVTFSGGDRGSSTAPKFRRLGRTPRRSVVRRHHGRRR